jgi:hypothetical protein
MPRRTASAHVAASQTPGSSRVGAVWPSLPGRSSLTVINLGSLRPEDVVRRSTYGHSIGRARQSRRSTVDLRDITLTRVYRPRRDTITVVNRVDPASIG